MVSAKEDVSDAQRILDYRGLESPETLDLPELRAMWFRRRRRRFTVVCFASMAILNAILLALSEWSSPAFGLLSLPFNWVVLLIGSMFYFDEDQLVVAFLLVWATSIPTILFYTALLRLAYTAILRPPPSTPANTASLTE